MILKRKTGDQSISNDASVDPDADLKLTGLAAGDIYEFEANIFVVNTNATPDFQWALDVPGTANVSIQYGWLAEDSGTTNLYGTVVTADNATQVGYQPASAPGTAHFTMKGSFVVGDGGGDFLFKWSQRVANAATTTLKANSYMRFGKLN